MKLISKFKKYLIPSKKSFNLYNKLNASLNFTNCIDFLQFCIKSIYRLSIKTFILLLLFTSCSYEEDNDGSLNIEGILTDNPEEVIKVDIIYVLPSGSSNRSIYNLNESDFIKNLNGSFFHRHNIGLVMGETKTIINNELYDLRDNRGSEASTFLLETQESYNKNRMNIYIIKRAHTIALAGIGRDQRALITDEFLYTTTAPHEIGHALGLFHYPEEGNIMSEINPHLRRVFTDTQVQRMKDQIQEIESN